MLDDARFCRKCGKPSTRLASESVTEGTTRILETPEASKVFGQEFYEQHGSLAQPTTPIPPQANQTERNLAVAEPKRQNWALIASLIFVGCALLATILFFALRGSSTAAPSVVIKREIPPVPQPPHPPTLPPMTAQPTSAISAEYLYPGAEKLMETISSNEGNVVQLKTSDSFDKVVNWYEEKLRPTNIVKQKAGDESQVILNAPPMNAVITEDNSGDVKIILHQEK
jgi:hypothetical protein